MQNSQTEAALQYRTHITDVTNGYLGNLSPQLDLVVATKILSCHDPLCKPQYGSGRFPGSLLGLHREGVQDELYRKLRDNGAVEIDAFHHLGCGYLFTYLDLLTASDQNHYIDENKSFVEKYAKNKFGLRVDFQDGGYRGGASKFLD